MVSGYDLAIDATLGSAVDRLEPLMRSKLGNPEAQVERHSFPSVGRIIAEQTAAVSVDEKTIEEGYRTRLY